MTQAHPALPLEMVSTVSRNWRLVTSLTRREVVGRYRGSMMGMLWSFFHPLLMLGVYTFVFGLVLKTRWSGTGDSTTEFALVLFCGLMVFGLFAECVTRAPALILGNVNYVKKVVFPLEILPWVSLGAAMFHLLISFAVWLTAYIAVVGLPKPTVVLFPLVLVPLALLTLGVSWLLASLGVYLRDTSQFVGIFTTAMMFLSPVFYPASSLPTEYRWILDLNPLTPVIEFTRDVLIRGHVPAASAFSAYCALSAATAWFGFAWFQKTRKGFADVV